MGRSLLPLHLALVGTRGLLARRLARSPRLWHRLTTHLEQRLGPYTHRLGFRYRSGTHRYVALLYPRHTPVLVKGQSVLIAI